MKEQCLRKKQKIKNVVLTYPREKSGQFRYVIKLFSKHNQFGLGNEVRRGMHNVEVVYTISSKQYMYSYTVYWREVEVVHARCEGERL